MFDIVLLMLVVKPCLPFLVETGGKVGEKILEGAAGKVGEDLVDKFKQVWGKIQPKVAEKPGAQEALEKAIAHPDDDRRITALELALEDLIAELAEKQPEWVAELVKLLEEAKPAATTYQIQQSVTGNQNQVIGVNSGKAIGSIGTVQGNVAQ
jgi:hypothetical protein